MLRSALTFFVIGGASVGIYYGVKTGVIGFWKPMGVGEACAKACLPLGVERMAVQIDLSGVHRGFFCECVRDAGVP